MGIYEIAGIPLSFEPRFNDYFGKHLKNYAADVEALYAIHVDVVKTIKKPQRPATFSKGARAVYEYADKTVFYSYDTNGDVIVRVENTRDFKTFSITLREGPKATLAELEFILSGVAFFDIALLENRLALHASALAYRGKALLFSAPSQTGKSTLRRHWLNAYGETSRVINDDKPLLYKENDRYYAAGSPFSGKALLDEDIALPIKAIIFIERARQCELLEIDEATALKELMRNALRPHDEKLVARLLDIVDDLIGRVPFYVYRCTDHETSARILHDTLYSEGR